MALFIFQDSLSLNIKAPYPHMRIGCFLVEDFAHSADVAAYAAATEAFIVGRPYGNPVDGARCQAQSTVVEGLERCPSSAHRINTNGSPIFGRHDGGRHRRGACKSAIADTHLIRAS